MTPWDAVVVGAGPAGSVTARELARTGLRVVLIDQSAFPRPKACGGCLNRAALAGLSAVGLGHVPTACGAAPIRTIRIASGTTAADVPLPGGLAVSRHAFDAALLTEAAAAGVTVRTGVRASLGEVSDQGRTVHLHTAEPEDISSRVVVLATGLAGAVGPTSPDSRIGVGVVVPDGPALYEPGTIYMAVSKHGYVGLVRVEDGRLDVAAAFDPTFVRSNGGPGPAVTAVLGNIGWPLIPESDHLLWKGTPFLTRRPDAIAGERWFAVGDAAGYVEPFTGEGMAWAVASARAVVPFAARAAAGWDDRLIARWTRTHRRLIGRRQWACGFISRVLRYPIPTRGALAAVARLPRLARPFVAALNRPIPLSTGWPA